MVIPTPRASADDTQAGRLNDIAAELRRIYSQAFDSTLDAATRARGRFEFADGTDSVDPLYAADTAGCRAVNGHLTRVVSRHLPGATRLPGVDEPAVIDSCWLHRNAVVVIEWDHSYDFGDPDALVIRELGR